MFDNHVHSSFSVDSDMDAYIACETAIKSGLQGIAFTDHVDFDFPGYSNDFAYGFDDYQKLINNLKLEYNTRLKVLRGVEVGIQPHVIERSLNLISKYELDYILASVHVIEGEDLCGVDFYDNKSKKQSYSRYLEEVLHMINNFTYFDVVGHFDYITRYCNYEDRTLRYSDDCDIFDEIFKKLIANGKGIEINTGSYRKKGDGRTVPKYDIEILKRYRQLGGEITCLGSDSHTHEYIGYKFDFFSEMLLQAGFRYTSYFENRKVNFIPL
jgi:histidinol-phosphatase (PHP family)